MKQPASSCLPQGVISDLVTPFEHDGKVDDVALTRLVGRQIDSGIGGLLACGPTGEPWALSRCERKAVIELCVNLAGRIPVIAGTGTNSTETTIAQTADAQSIGASAAYIVTPYYSKPTQEGILRHFEAISHAVDLPIIVGLEPQRTASDINPATLERLATISTVVGIADATGDISRLLATNSALKHRFKYYSSDDLTALSFELMGGIGTFSSVANALPKMVVALHEAIGVGDIQGAQSLQERLFPFLETIKDEGIPALKSALHLLVGTNDDVRLPLVPVNPAALTAICTAIGPYRSRYERARWATS